MTGSSSVSIVYCSLISYQMKLFTIVAVCLLPLAFGEEFSNQNFNGTCDFCSAAKLTSFDINIVRNREFIDEIFF